MSEYRRERRPRLLRGRTRSALAVLRGTTPPAYPVASRSRDALVDDLVAYEVMDLTQRMGEAMVSSGSPVPGVTATMLRVAAAYGLTSVQVDITFTSITISVVRDDGEPMTSMRIVKVRAADYSRLARIHELADAAVDGLPLEQALDRLDAIVHAPHPYRRWLVTLALAGLAAGVGGLLGGGLGVAALAAVVTACVDRLLRVLDRWALPAFFQQAVAAAFVTLVALLAVVLRPYLPYGPGTFPPSLVVGTGIVVLLAGLGLVGAVEDAISGYYLTAASRSFEVVLQTLGIVVGIGAVLDLATRSGLELSVLPRTAPAVPLPGLVVIAAAVASCWALSSYARLRAALVAAVGGGAAFTIYTVLRDLGVGPAVASGFAALVVGAVADVAGERLGVPALVVATSGVVPLLPGLATYRAMFTLVEEEPFQGVVLLLGAGIIGLGLAAGVALGQWVARPLRSGVDRWERRVRRRARQPRD